MWTDKKFLYLWTRQPRWYRILTIPNFLFETIQPPKEGDIPRRDKLFYLSLMILVPIFGIIVGFTATPMVRLLMFVVFGVIYLWTVISILLIQKLRKDET